MAITFEEMVQTILNVVRERDEAREMAVKFKQELDELKKSNVREPDKQQKEIK